MKAHSVPQRLTIAAGMLLAFLAGVAMTLIYTSTAQRASLDTIVFEYYGVACADAHPHQATHSANIVDAKLSGRVRTNVNGFGLSFVAPIDTSLETGKRYRMWVRPDSYMVIMLIRLVVVREFYDIREEPL